MTLFALGALYYGVNCALMKMAVSGGKEEDPKGSKEAARTSSRHFSDRGGH